MTRARATIVAAAMTLAAAAPAQAKKGVAATPAFGENAPKNYQSSQWFAFELKFSPYSPRIDS